jgi:hypothetical protein
MQDDRDANVAGQPAEESSEPTPPAGAPAESGAERARRARELNARTLQARPPLPTEDAAAQVERIRAASRSRRE